jgi:hypothetical protein
MAASTDNGTKELTALAKRDAKARKAAEEARAAFVAELQARRPGAADRAKVAEASGLSVHRLVQLARS